MTLDLDKLAELVAAMTPGPWNTASGYGSDVVISSPAAKAFVQCDGVITDDAANANALVALVNAAPDMIRLAREHLAAADRIAQLEGDRCPVCDDDGLIWPTTHVSPEGDTVENPEACPECDGTRSGFASRMRDERDAALARLATYEQANADHRARIVALEKTADAARAEVERWRHGVQIEGDYVCPDSLALMEARAEVERLRPVVEAALAWSAVGFKGTPHLPAEQWPRVVLHRAIGDYKRAIATAAPAASSVHDALGITPEHARRARALHGDGDISTPAASESAAPSDEIIERWSRFLADHREVNAEGKVPFWQAVLESVLTELSGGEIRPRTVASEPADPLGGPGHSQHAESDPAATSESRRRRAEDVERVARRLAAIAMEDLCGSDCPGRDEWEAVARASIAAGLDPRRVP